MKRLFAWTGAVLFLASLLSFVFTYLWRLRVPAPPSDAAARDALTNVALFTVFALHHSVMARSGAKAWLARVLPAELERSVYVWIASLLFLAVCWWWRPLPGVAWHVTGAWTWLLPVIQATGLALTIAATRIVGVWELAGVKPANPSRPVQFTAVGPFAIVRHPIYLSWVLLVFAVPLMTTSRLLFAVVSTAYLIAAIPWEEASLVNAFGDKYRAYQRQVRWRLVPRVW